MALINETIAPTARIGTNLLWPRPAAAQNHVAAALPQKALARDDVPRQAARNSQSPRATNKGAAFWAFAAVSSGRGTPRAYFPGMEHKTRVLYNETCPICRFEVESYRRRTDAAGGAVAYDELDHAANWGLSLDQAARRFHVMQDGKLLSGLPAFRALWQQMPNLRWLAWLTGLPVIAPLSAAVYDHILAPILYRAHLRRQRRKAAQKT